MKKIMFDNNYGLTDAVLKGNKTMTRRICREFRTLKIIDANEVESVGVYSDENLVEFVMKDGSVKVSVPRYKVGDVVAVAQAYKDIEEYSPWSYEDVMLDQGTICEASHPYSHLMKSGGWENKMFVRADLMPHQIRITDIKAERMQDISDEDCLKEGVVYDSRHWVNGYKVENLWNKIDRQSHFRSAQVAFANLINRISGKGTWEKNPYVFVYIFELVK